jgi:integral membrane protein
VNPSVAPALTRYRIAAYVVGVGLLVLVFVAIPVKYIGGHPTPSAIISPIHGFFYMAYLVCTLDLGLRLKWSIPRIVGVMLAGTVPFLSFYFEHRIAKRVKDGVDPAARRVPEVATSA